MYEINEESLELRTGDVVELVRAIEEVLRGRDVKFKIERR